MIQQDCYLTLYVPVRALISGNGSAPAGQYTGTKFFIFSQPPRFYRQDFIDSAVRDFGLGSIPPLASLALSFFFTATVEVLSDSEDKTFGVRLSPSPSLRFTFIMQLATVHFFILGRETDSKLLTCVSAV